MGGKKNKFNLNTIIRESILVNRYKNSKFDKKLSFEWNQINFNRKAVVNRLLAVTPGGAYLEIGCAGNDLFDAVMAPRKVGVDPARGGTHRMTSDTFFASYRGEPFDVVFIDGLHTYDQVRRDLAGALRVLKPGGWIALHDMLPRDWLEEHVPQVRTRGWTGDGWKLAFELAAATGVDFRLLALDHGVVVVRPLRSDPEIPDLSEILQNERFPYLYNNLSKLPMIDFAEAAAWIAGYEARGKAEPGYNDA